MKEISKLFKSNNLFYWDETDLVHKGINITKNYIVFLSIGLLIGVSTVLMLDNYILQRDIIYYRNHVLIDYDEIEKYRLKEIVIEKIKIEEGFKAKKYLCPSKKTTIGYGHVVKKNEKFKNNITEDEADRILRKDFDYFYSVISKKYPNLEYTKQLALTHLLFNIGETKFNKSSIPNLIKKQLNNEVKKKILEYDKAKTEVKKSNGEISLEYTQFDNLTKAREFEAYLWDYEKYKNIN